MKNNHKVRNIVTAFAAAATLGLAAPAMAQDGQSGYSANQNYSTVDRDVDRDMDWGWLGLLGLAGLFGLRRRRDEPVTPYNNRTGI